MSNGMAPKNYIKIDFSNKTDQLIGYINSGETEVLSPKSKPNNEIGPGTPSEALANAVADQLKIPHIYKGGAERWQWFHSTNTESYYIATDATSYNTKTNLYSVWIKTVRAAKGSNYPIYYVFDFTNHTWGFSSFNHMKTVEPDSWQEIIYNGAYDLCKNYMDFEIKNPQSIISAFFRHSRRNKKAGVVFYACFFPILSIFEWSWIRRIHFFRQSIFRFVLEFVCFAVLSFVECNLDRLHM